MTGADTRRVRLALGLAASALLAVAPPVSALQGPDRPAVVWHVVPEERLIAAMNEVHGYELTATTNGARLQADVLRQLIREQEARDPERRPLFIGHREWYEALLARTGLESSAGPLYARLSYEMEQDVVVDYRREHVVDAVLRGPAPRITANVRVFWPKKAGKPDHYSYDDLVSKPHLRVTQKQLMSYRMIDYEDRLWYAEVRGLHGRPTSGPLGLLFDLIGEARVVESRSSVLPDGVQVVRGHASKWGFDRTETLTVWRDGRADRGVPPDRPDLLAAEARLKEPLEIRFRPLPPEP